MNIRAAIAGTAFWRSAVQWVFFCWILFVGLQFGLFVHHFESGGAAPYYQRPAGVEGFLPIGALVSLKHWLSTGIFDTIHPAALVLFLTFVSMSLLAKKSFCSWLCPVGTLSEGLWKIGRRLFGRNFHPWRRLDVALRGAKYLLLLFFIKIILLDMPALALGSFLKAPYWAVSDVRMLHFFTAMSATTLTAIAVLAGLSLFYRNAWCRYLCPYGALLGLVSMMSPMKIRRREDDCTGCRRCSGTCPSRLPVHRKVSVLSPECTGCLSCASACPEGALSMTTALPKKAVPRWAFPALVLTIYAGGVFIGMASGHWETSLTYRDFQQLIPMAPFLSH